MLVYQTNPVGVEQNYEALTSDRMQYFTML